MKRTKELTAFIKNGQRGRANSLLDSIYEEYESRAYCAALEKMLLIEAAEELNDSVRGFYIDTKNLKEALFSDNPPTRKTVFDSFRDILCDAQEGDRKRSFDKAVCYIKQNLADSQLSVLNVAEYSGLSEIELTRLFRDNKNKTAGEYINKKRVEKSLVYLERGETISQASEKTGFSSCETFIRVFKKYMKMTPGVWKRNKLFL